MKANDKLNTFGELLIENVRDRTIDKYNRIIEGKMKDANSLKLHTFISQLDENAKSILHRVIMDTIDNQLFNTLTLFEQNEEYLVGYLGEKEVFHNLVDESDGLAGELLGDDGWIKKYSKYE
ncbi:MAG: hypothetical protein LBV71_17955 [Prevotella sp.]|jgi:hypothetical protein|nr:hypothetical protein [Prevotella sp.]